MEEHYKNVNTKLNNAVNSQIEGPNYKREFYPRIVNETNILFTKREYDIFKNDLNLTYTKNQKRWLKMLFGSWHTCKEKMCSWIKRDQLDVTCFIISLFNANMFRMLIHPSPWACDLFVELFHGLYCSGSMCVGVTLWFGCGSVVSVCRLRQCLY